MRKNFTRLAAVGLYSLATWAFAGCGPAASTNLSPTAKSDPDRHQRAVQETEEKVKRDQEAEREAFRGVTKAMPG
jgi:hypothetical protein